MWNRIKRKNIKALDLKMVQMVFAAVFVFSGYRLWQMKQEEKPSPIIPAQSFERYVKIQKEAKRKLEMLKYMVCLREHKNKNEDCRYAAKDYFQCRMDAGLMDKDAWPRLGFK
uniref:CHCH domain-containing protein n=1 Tax=Panagrolaimus sp. ES5 TaxID=591445 RepID=A0AC34FXL7_9BILA